MASKLTESFKALTKVLLGTSEDIPGDSLADVVDYLAENYEAPTGEPGADGADGASVTAITLTVDGGGAVTGGTATLSDESTVTITVNAG